MIAEDEKVLEEFLGYVDAIRDGVAYVTLESKRNSDRLYGEYPEEKLAENGILEQDSFVVRVVEKGEWMRLDFEKSPKVELSDEMVQKIKDEIEAMLPDDGVDF